MHRRMAGQARGCTKLRSSRDLDVQRGTGTRCMADQAARSPMGSRLVAP